MNGQPFVFGSSARPRISRRVKSRMAWVALALCAIAAVGAIAWVKLAAATRTDVSVSQAAPVTCRGATVTHRRVTDSLPSMDVVHATESMRCTLTLRFENEGSRSVHLETATFPFMGPETGGLLRLTGPLVPFGEGDFTGIDAEVRLDRDLSGGASFTGVYHFVFNSAGCVDGTMWVGSVPTVSDEAWGLSGSVEGSVGLAFIGHGDTPGCPR